MSPTPEEKLLHLIRAGEKEKKKDARSASEYAPHQQISLGLLRKVKWLHPQNIIFLALFLSASFLVYTFIFPYKPSDNVRENARSFSSPSQDDANALKEPLSKQAFIAEISRRNVFEPLGGSADSGTASNQTSSEAFKDLNLVAVIDGKNPQAVIENKKIQKVFYVREGDTIDSFQIEKVTSGRVTLNYKGEKYDLAL